MPLIDFNGRLFGKINIIDLLIVLVLLFGLIFAGRLIYKLAIPDKTWVIVNFKFDKVELEVANSIRAGYVEKIADKVVAEVLDLKLLDIKFISATNTFIRPVLLKVRLLAEIENNQLIHNDKNLMVGTRRSLILGPKDSEYGYVYLSDGFVIDIDKKIETNRMEKVIEVELYNQYPWISEAIKIVSKKLDSQNETVIEVLSKEVVPNQFIYVTEAGEVLIRENPIRDDIRLRLKLRGEVAEDNVFVFENVRVLVGSWIPLELDKNLSLSGIVTKIE